MRKLSTWLVLALTAGAFAAGLTGGALLGGDSNGHSHSASSTAPTRSSAGAPRISTVTVPTKAKAEGPSSRKPQATPRGTVGPLAAQVPRPTPPTPAAVRSPRPPSAVPLPEANPVAVGSPPAAGPVPVAMPPAAAPPAAPAATVGGAGEPVQVEPGAGRAGIGAALNELEAAAAHSGKAVHTVVQELCLEMAASLPAAQGGGEQMPFSCEAS